MGPTARHNAAEVDGNRANYLPMAIIQLCNCESVSLCSVDSSDHTARVHCYDISAVVVIECSAGVVTGLKLKV